MLKLWQTWLPSWTLLIVTGLGILWLIMEFSVSVVSGDRDKVKTWHVFEGSRVKHMCCTRKHQFKRTVTGIVIILMSDFQTLRPNHSVNNFYRNLVISAVIGSVSEEQSEQSQQKQLHHQWTRCRIYHLMSDNQIPFIINDEVSLCVLLPNSTIKEIHLGNLFTNIILSFWYHHCAGRTCKIFAHIKKGLHLSKAFPCNV